MNTHKKETSLWLKISSIDEILASVFLAIIVILSAYGVVTRYVLNSPSAWVEEVCIVFFIWFTFLASSALAKNNELIRIDYLLTKIPARLANIIDGIFQPLVMIFCLVFMAYLGFKLLPMAQFRFTPSLQLSYAYIYAAIPISASFMLFYEVRKIVYFFKINRGSQS
ncbi:TRAP-type C4-dicarboxylate transport system, small permease component [Pasteurella testudinis DSM 23072]|uniref:TRAP transporter small permease protein n=2 Tax=Pasteurellaceae TaxID=712 RepID=A0A4R3YBQ3_9PAST|nr:MULTISPECIES: TRAP transporter small permease [Pasteurellaceae]KAE9529822.1 C4-dicarboxylate ABC transporter substrate-binding protein [Testudinibacter aquarius]TCV89416.1 TRAP-type C4-dicarboxylate transport system permease small subunit [Testudinibacter aquarius]TNG90080.1 TRAP transporter small permease [Testudinibacter aquarius]SMB87633.1 TRAP-type C4-dicarboxylate transport system, small permease component [Pasteurella testudinis DSM 23072]SUB50485.1 Trap-type c4-dicarboxylate transpor